MQGRLVWCSQRDWDAGGDSILEFLEALNQHLSEYPYLLGWKPSIGDFGLIAPLYAHLGRDPAPLRIMQQRAVRVARWVERMNRADQDAPEFFNPGDDYLADDSIPETLVAVLRVLAEDLVPETHAAAAVINQWLADNQPEPGTSAQGSLGQRMFGMAQFNLRGQSISAVAQSYRFVILQKLATTVCSVGVSAAARGDGFATALWSRIPAGYQAGSGIGMVRESGCLALKF